MSVKTGCRPMKGSSIRSILANNPSVSERSIQKTDAPAILLTLSKRAEYDTTNPEKHIAEFVSFSRVVITRYEENVRMIDVYDKETQDILHYVELHENMNAAQGNDMYKKLRDVRRKRRQCKNEIDLLEPVYQFFKNQNSNLADQLAAVQGKCKQLRSGIDSRQYTLRTGVIQ